jgi:hypothetical protein
LSRGDGSRLVAFALGAGVAVPFLYFGAQLAAAPFFPGYSFLRQSASMLGSDLSTCPAILNVGAVLTGVATLIAAAGFLPALRSRGTPRGIVWLTCMALVSSGLASVWAGTFHLPDPRHNPGLLGAGSFLLPFLLAAAFWRSPDAPALRIYLLANLLFMLALVPVMSGKTGIDRASYGGLLQRIAAATLFPPIGVVAWVLRRAPR